MTDTPADTQWIRRCADQLYARHSFPREEALELAAEAYQMYGQAACPERTADEIMGLALHAG